MSLSRDKIEASKDVDLLLQTEVSGKQLVDLNAQVSPAVLSGVLGCNVQQIYQYRQDGKLPPNADASLRDCVKWHVSWYKKKSISKSSNMAEAALVQKIKLDRAKTEQTWLVIKKERAELVDVNILAEEFEQHFIQLRTELCALARRHPDLQKEIDNILASWVKLGKTMQEKSESELTDFIEAKMEEEIEIEEAEESNGDSDG